MFHCIFDWTLLANNNLSGQPAMAVKYTDCISAVGYAPHHNECPRYDTKQSEGEALVILELWWIPFISITPGSGAVSPDWVLSMCQIEVSDI